MAGAAPTLRRWLRSGLVGSVVALAVTGPGCRSKEQRKAEKAAPALMGLGAMPASVDQVAGIDVALLAASPLVERGVRALLDGDPELAEDLAAILDGCHLDVVRDVRRLWLGLDRDTPPAAGAATAGAGAPATPATPAGDGRAILVIEGRLAEGQLSACVGKALGPSGGRLTGERVGGRTHFHIDQAEGRPDLWFAAVGEGVVVVASSADFLAEAAGDGPKLDGAADLAALVERAGPAHALWFAGSVPPEVGQSLGKAAGAPLGPPRSMFGHLDLAGGAIDAELGVVMGSAEDAAEGASLIKAHLATLALVAQQSGLGRLVHQVGAEGKADTLYLRLAIPEEDVRTLVGTTVDREGGGDQNAAPSAAEVNQGVDAYGQGDAGPGDEAPVRK